MITVTYRDKKWEMPGQIAVRDLIIKAGLSPEAVLAVRQGRLVLDSDQIDCRDLGRVIFILR